MDVARIKIYQTQIVKRSHRDIKQLFIFFFSFIETHFLIRDWQYPYEYCYGKDGGNAYIRKQLEVGYIYHA